MTQLEPNREKTTSLSRQIAFFAVPLLLSNFFQQLYNTMDAAIVGHFAGDAALAAIGSAGQLTVFLIYFFIGLSTGASIRISLSFGEGRAARLQREVHTAVVLGAVSGAVLTILGVLFAPSLLRLMNLSGETLAAATVYIRLYFTGMIPMMLYNMGSGILRAVGDSRTPLFCLLISGAVNVALDLLFVPVLGWSTAGAAAATALAQLVSCVLVFYKLCRTTDSWRVSLRLLRIDRAALGSIVRLGVPAGLQSVLVTFSNVIVQSQVNRFGLDTMAGVTAYMKIEGILYMPIEAMSLAVSNFVGRTLGAGRKDEIGQVTRCGLRMILAVTLVLEAALLLGGRPLLGIFSHKEQVLHYALAMLHTLVPVYFLYAINQTLVGSIRGMGNAVSPMRITLLSMCALRIVWITAGLALVNDIRVIFLSYPITWIATLLFLSLCYRKTARSLL